MKSDKWLWTFSGLITLIFIVGGAFLYHGASAREHVENLSPVIGFAEDRVIVVLTHEASLAFCDYGLADFPEVSCCEVYNLTSLSGMLVKTKLDYQKDNPKSEMPLALQRVDVDKYHAILRLSLQESGVEAVEEAIQALQDRDDILSVEPDYVVSQCLTAPNDPYCFYENYQWGHDIIQLEYAWDIETGSDDITVAVLDTGIDSTHDDLVNRVDVSRSYDFTSGYPVANTLITEDPHGHGTFVAGIIGAEGNNATDICGVCWDVQLVSYRIINEFGEGYSSNAVLAIDHASFYEIPILNMSFRWYDNNIRFTQHLDIAIGNYPGLAVCAAGNENCDNDSCSVYPANYDLPNLITVGASDYYDRKCSFSNYGQTRVDLFAPGDYCYSCQAGGGIRRDCGTSVAAPYVSGVAALLLSIDPDLTPQMLKHILMDNSEIIYDDLDNSVFGTLCVSGGRLNAYEALAECTDPFDYASLGIFRGHKYYCIWCNETIRTSEHNWLQRPGGWICGTCGQWTTAIPTPLGE